MVLELHSNIDFFVLSSVIGKTCINYFMQILYLYFSNTFSHIHGNKNEVSGFSSKPENSVPNGT